MDQRGDAEADRDPIWELDALAFELGDQRFALPLADVLEVVRAVALRRLPNAPSIVEGILDLRGEIVPVLDLRARFGLPPSALHASDHLIVASTGARVVALRVDRALALHGLRARRSEHARNLPRGVPHIAGVASVADDLLLIHDLRAFLSAAEAEQLSGALTELAAAGSEGPA